MNFLKLHLHGVYLGQIAHDFHVLVKYPATDEDCLEAIIGHTMSGKPPGEQIGEDSALNLPITAVQDRIDPIDEGLDFIDFFVVRIPHVATPYVQHPVSDHSWPASSAHNPANLLAAQTHTTAQAGGYSRTFHISSRLANFSPEMPVMHVDPKIGDTLSSRRL